VSRVPSLALLIAVSAAAGGASAADVQFDPSVEVGAIFNDNFTLERAGGAIEEVSGAFVEAGLQVIGEAPRGNWRIEPRVRTTSFPDDGELESTDYFLTAAGERRNERNAFGFTADFYDQFIAWSQLPNANFGNSSLGEGTGPDSGRIVSDNRQQLLRANPYATFKLSERTDLRVDLNALEVSFDRDVANALVSFRSVGGRVLLDRQFTPASRFGLRLEYEQVDPDSGAGRSDLAGAQLQWDYRIAERLSAYGRVGVKRSDFEVVGPGPARVRSSVQETTPLFAAGMRWTFVKSELFVDLQRVLDANSAGFVVERDDLRVFYNHRFNARLSAYVGGYVIRDEAVSAGGLNIPRRYNTALAGLEWRVLRALAVRGEIARSYQAFEGDLTTADGNSVRVSLAYRPRRTE
jgi:hypothetical protein